MHPGPLSVPGLPCRVGMTRSERFWAKVDQRGPDECWPWTGASEKNGYGRFGWASYEVIRAHTALLRLLGITVPKGYEPDHTCFNKLCCNPAHIEVVTAAENRRRATARRIARVGYVLVCPAGHDKVGENLLIDSRGSRRCRRCTTEKAREGHLRRAARRAAA